MSFADAYWQKIKVNVKTTAIVGVFSLSVLNVIDFVILAKNSKWKKKQ